MVFILGYGVVTSIGTDNQTLMLLGVALMVVLVLVSTALMSVIGSAPKKATETVPGGV